MKCSVLKRLFEMNILSQQIVKLVMIMMMIVNIARDGRAIKIKLEIMEFSWESDETHFQGSLGS